MAIAKPLDQLETLDAAVEEAIRVFHTRKDQIGFVCLWEAGRAYGALPTRETCFGTAVERLLAARVEGKIK